MAEIDPDRSDMLNIGKKNMFSRQFNIASKKIMRMIVSLEV